MAHVFEKLAIHVVTCYGSKIGFFSGDMLKLKEDCIVFKPNIFFSVPRVLSKIH